MIAANASPQLQSLLNQAAASRSGWRTQLGWVVVLAVLILPRLLRWGKKIEV